ncbi:hypothetical protein N9W34_06705 [Rickettsiales bacterium]|nr:hypothetical protein [Rickettsiales bacterium]
MTYNRGTLAEFNIWHDYAMMAEAISASGKVGLVKGVPAPENQRTMAYSVVIKHPVNADDYIWAFGDYPHADKDQLSLDDVAAEGWFAYVRQ